MRLPRAWAESCSFRRYPGRRYVSRRCLGGGELSEPKSFWCALNGHSNASGTRSCSKSRGVDLKRASEKADSRDRFWRDRNQAVSMILVRGRRASENKMLFSSIKRATFYCTKVPVKPVGAGGVGFVDPDSSGCG